LKHFPNLVISVPVQRVDDQLELRFLPAASFQYADYVVFQYRNFMERLALGPHHVLQQTVRFVRFQLALVRVHDVLGHRVRYKLFAARHGRLLEQPARLRDLPLAVLILHVNGVGRQIELRRGNVPILVLGFVPQIFVNHGLQNNEAGGGAQYYRKYGKYNRATHGRSSFNVSHVTFVRVLVAEFAYAPK